MPQRNTVHVTIYDNVIKAHFTQNGAVGHDAEGVGRQAVDQAKIRAGRRSGHLQAGISFGRQPNPSGYTYLITMVSSASYTNYVNDGTLGKIIRAKRPMVRNPKTGRYISGGMHLPPYGAHGAKILDEVRGQRPKKFLQLGMRYALRRHGYPDFFNA